MNNTGVLGTMTSQRLVTKICALVSKINSEYKMYTNAKTYFLGC